MAKDNDLQQLAFFGFKVGQQTQGFHAFNGHGLRFVQANHRLLAIAVDVQQARLDLFVKILVRGKQ